MGGEIYITVPKQVGANLEKRGSVRGEGASECL